MALRYLPNRAVAGDPAALRNLAQRLLTLAREVANRNANMSAGVAATNSSAVWTGAAANAYRSRMTTELRPYTSVTNEVLPVVARACQDLAAKLEQAQREMAAAISAVAASGIGNASIVLGAVCWGRSEYATLRAAQPQLGAQASQYPDYFVENGDPGALWAFLHQHKQTVSAVQPYVDQASHAFLLAREGRVAFVRAVGGARESLARILYTTPTASELALDARVSSGEVGDYGTWLQGFTGTQDGQGRLILYRYGHPYSEGGVFYHNDGYWSTYLSRNDVLRGQVRDIITDVARNAALNGGTSFDVRQNAEIANGYASGYEQLHGTEATVGDFHVDGVSSVVPNAAGGYDVTVNARYTWNDVIDPNSIYGLDTVGSTIYPGKAYDLHIGWDATTTVVLDSQRRVIGIRGYPN
jgi:hypothetical protein